MPLRAEGTGKPKAFLGGVLSGIVEPIGAISRSWRRDWIVPALPYLLSFAAGAMLYVVVEELIPGDVAGRALGCRYDILCSGIQRHDDARCGAGLILLQTGRMALCLSGMKTIEKI